MLQEVSPVEGDTSFYAAAAQGGGIRSRLIEPAAANVWVICKALPAVCGEGENSKAERPSGWTWRKETET